MKTIGKHGRVAVYRRLDSTKGRLGNHKVAMYVWGTYVRTSYGYMRLYVTSYRRLRRHSSQVGICHLHDRAGTLVSL